MKALFESNLLYLRNFTKNKTKPVGNFSCLRVFNIFPACASFPHKKNSYMQASVLRADIII